MTTDSIFALLAGLTDREIAKLLAKEMRRRNLYGCIFLLPAAGGSSVFASSTPAGTMSGMSAATQLATFAEVARQATGEIATTIGEEIEPDKGWVN